MTDKLLPNRVIVDRIVLVELLEREHIWLDTWGLDDARRDRVIALRHEVASGERVELYERDWPTSDDP